MGTRDLAGMEKEKSDQIKQFLLAAFVLVCVSLVILVWANALLDREPQGPNFYRSTVPIDTTFYTTQTAEAASGALSSSTQQHKNEQATPIRSPTTTPTPTEGVDQVN